MADKIIFLTKRRPIHILDYEWNTEAAYSFAEYREDLGTVTVALNVLAPRDGYRDSRRIVHGSVKPEEHSSGDEGALFAGEISDEDDVVEAIWRVATDLGSTRLATEVTNRLSPQNL